jgi:DNA polymerase-3 subunit alpha
MLSVLRQVKPDNLEDLVALISLYRPGPMGNIPTYIARKHGLEKVDYRHPQLEEILRDTYGVIIYQEQVMNIAKSLAGYTLGAADLLRRAMGKKIKEEMDKQRSVFVEGCRRHSQMSDTLSGEIFDLMAKFAEYGFPKAHATAYALISYQTAYLKANFPVEFMTATLNMEIMDTDKISYYLQDVKRHHWKILLPDINKSDAFFGVELVTPTSDIGPDATNGHAGKELAIRYGLGALKGIGPELMAEVVEERSRNGSFRDIFDFCRRMGPRIINKKTLESLAKSGSFDELHPNRRQICESGEILGNYAKAVALEESSSQISLFEDWDRNRKLLPQLVQMEDWCGHERFQGEFEVFGFYPTHHPLDILAEELKAQGIIFWEQLEANGAANFTALLAGVILSTSIRSNDRGRYAHITMSDPTGIAELFFYGGDLLSNYQHLLDDREHRQVVCECGVRKDETGMRLSVKDLWSLDDYLRLPKSKRSSRAAVVKPLLSPADIPLVSLKIHLAGERGLEELAQLLSKVQLPDCPPTRLEIITADDTVQLPDIYHLTQLDAKRIKDIYGVTAVEMEPNSSCRDGADSSSS